MEFFGIDWNEKHILTNYVSLLSIPKGYEDQTNGTTAEGLGKGAGRKN